MAIVCSRCGNQNPDANAFCSKCGAPLAAAAPAGPPGAGAPAPTAQPPGAQPPAPAIPTPSAPAPTPALAGAPSPPGAPARTLGSGPPGAGGPMPPPLPATPPPASGRRLSRNAIIAIVVVAVLIIGGAAVAFAMINKGPNTPKPSVPSALPSSNPSAPATLPPATSASASAAPSAQPSAQPSSSAGPTSGGTGTSVETAYATIVVPAGFNDQGTTSSGGCQSNTLTQSNENGLIVYGECTLPSGTTNSAFDQALLAGDQQALDPSAALCNPNKPSPIPLTGSGGSANADEVQICANITPQNGPAFKGTDFYISAIAHKSDGSTVGIFVNFFAPSSEFDAFLGKVPDSVLKQTIFKQIGP